MNIIQVAGRLGNDPEVRFTPSGSKVTSFRLASNKKRGEKEETIWWKITIWGDRFDKMLAHVKKGSSVIVFGELNAPEIYTNKEGQPQVSLEINAEMIRFNPFGGKNETAPSGHAPAGSSSSYSDHPQSGSFSSGKGASHDDFNEDDLPF